MEILKPTVTRRKTAKEFQATTIVKDTSGKIWCVTTMQRIHGSITSRAQPVSNFVNDTVEIDYRGKIKPLIRSNKLPYQTFIKEQHEAALQRFKILQ